MPQVIFVDGFDHYSTADLSKKYAGVGASLTISGTGRNSTNGLHSAVDNFVGALTANTANYASIYIDVAFKTGNLPGADAMFIAFMDAGSVQTDLRMTATGELRVTRNGTSLAVTSGLGLITATYYHIGFMTTFDDTAGVYEVRVNGLTKLSGTSADTKNSSNAYANQVRLQSVNAASGSDFDDFIISTDGFCGDCRVQCLFPQGAGNYSQWTPSTGLGYQCVDEAAMNSDTDYVSSATPTQRNSYDFQAVAAGTIQAVQHVTTLRKDDTGSRSVKQFARVSSTDYDASAVSVTDTYLVQRRILLTNPATSTAWTSSGLDASEFGVKLES